MAWIYPVGTEDPDNVWENDEDALGGDSLTFATQHDLPPDTWSGFFVWDFPSRRYHVGQGLITIFGVGGAFDIDYHDGERWVDWQEDTVVAFAHPWQRHLYGKRISKIRARLKHFEAESMDVHVHWCRLYAPCEGPLALICEIFHDIADWFAGLADDIDDVMFVGDVLATPFRWAGDRFHDLSDTCCEASGALQDILDALQEGVTWEVILGLIQEHAPELYQVMTDPVGWFLVKLTLAFDLEPWHTQSLEFLAKWILEEYFPVLYHLWRDPDAWLAERLDALWEGVFTELRDFMENVWDWLLDRYEDAFDAIHAKLYYLAEHTVRYFWEGEW